MILSDTEILAARDRGEILIDPFDVNQLGGNSYDVRLGPVLRVYDSDAVTGIVAGWFRANGIYLHGHGTAHSNAPLDCAVEPKVIDIHIGTSGIVLVPGILYLASTVEYTETRHYVPYLDGKSSVGRLGISVHKTAGRGDAGNKDSPGFCGHWTMEIDVVQPVRVYAGMPIGQLTYHLVYGEVERAYQSKPGASYLDGRDSMPQPSRLWKKLQRSR